MRKKIMSRKLMGMAVCACLVSGVLSGCGETDGEKNAPTINGGVTVEPAAAATETPESGTAPNATTAPEPSTAPKTTTEPTTEPARDQVSDNKTGTVSEPTQVSFAQKGATMYSGEYKGLTWQVTDAGELIVTGHMGEADNFSVWTDAPWAQYSGKITTACMSFTGAKSLRNLFHGFSVLSEVDLSGLDTGSVTDMMAMFQNCPSLSSIDLSGFDTGNVTGMSYMFCGCESLTDLDLGSFDTGSVRGMSYMFCRCENLTSLDLSGFDTSSVQNMECMFASCTNLQEVLTGEQWQQPSRTDRMFFNCNISSVTSK